MTDQAQDQAVIDAAEKLLGKKRYEVFASELVYYAKIVWAYDEDEAEKIASEEGFNNEHIYDGDNFDISGVEELEDDR